MERENPLDIMGLILETPDEVWIPAFAGMTLRTPDPSCELSPRQGKISNKRNEQRPWRPKDHTMTPKQFFDWQTAGGTDEVMRTEF
jgi:hypothetical protein